MASFTRKAIEEAFLKLLDARPLNQITVKDIVEECGVNRNTFYYHFQDIPTLIKDIFTERAEALLKQRPDYASLEDALDEAVQMFIKNKRIVYHLYRSADRALVEMYLMRICEQVILSYIHDNRGDLPISQEDKTIIVRYYKCQCFGMIIDWLNSDMRFDISAETRRMYELRKGMPEEIVRRASMQRPKA